MYALYLLLLFIQPICYMRVMEDDTGKDVTVFPNTYLQVSWHFGCQRFSKFDNCMVQINSGGVLEELTLLHHSIHHIRMAVATRDRHNASKCIKIPLTTLVV